jgi:hypothetical protein
MPSNKIVVFIPRSYLLLFSLGKNISLLIRKNLLIFSAHHPPWSLPHVDTEALEERRETGG